MAEIDTRPLESVQAALNLFEQRSNDHSRSSSPDRNEQEIDAVTKELATCKLQLEMKDNENKQATLDLDALRKAMRELSEKYDRACLDAHRRISELESDNAGITRRQCEAACECEALRGELACARRELEALRGANAYVLEEVEAMETRRILERDSAREALARALELNEAVLSSAVAAIRAEEERSVFFQEFTMEMLSSGKDSEAVGRMQEAMEGVEEELLAKTVEVEILRSELLQLKELYFSSERAVVAVMPDSAAAAAASGNDGSAACNGSDPEIADACFGTVESVDGPNIRPDDGNIRGSLSERVVEGQKKPKKGVRFLEDYKSTSCGDKDTAMAGNRGFEAATTDAGFVTEISKDDREADGYVLVAKDGEAGIKDAAISDLRFTLEEALRRAELAEEAKAALERELRGRDEVQKQQQQQQRPPRPRPGRFENAPAPPARPRVTPSPAPKGGASPTPRCHGLTLGKVLNMKYK
ncbi:uncharacterized protein LOC106865767 [Brachypodium distachyon]|uniref:Uncharacterized protein n=1 Tax=Brachypodium distachyon TaxID=15368 RepID=I1H8A2_BRADI|nr:uncharacterized protein LOC106865767 [Brachypodium distachyon]KQK22984.1 hypothetical protein BRADI_1g70470v3 [Brachypodium distachyon]|eukprot:XP_014752039.1 uncharacterized protein LOC106865767 [Brachypodium distachyon]